MRASWRLEMRNLIAVLTLVIAGSWVSAASAQDMPADIVSFFETMAQLSTDNKSNCDAMGTALNGHLDANQNLLRDAAYADAVASPEQETAIMNAATLLGENAGACYETQSVVTFMDRFVKLATELDSGG